MSVQNKLRPLLRNTDGMTVQELVDATGHPRTSVQMALNVMPDAYIDRWVRAGGPVDTNYAAVWSVVVPPANCPHPVKGGREDEWST